jgi:hypothetical protein
LVACVCEVGTRVAVVILRRDERDTNQQDIAMNALTMTPTSLNSNITTASSGLKVKTSVKAGAGGIPYEPPAGTNHGLRVKASVKAGAGGRPYEPPAGMNHGLKVKTSVKAGAGGRPYEPPAGMNHGLIVKRRANPTK